MKYIAFDEFILRTPLFSLRKYVDKSGIDSSEFEAGLLLASKIFFEAKTQSPNSKQIEKTIYIHIMTRKFGVNTF